MQMNGTYLKSKGQRIEKYMQGIQGDNLNM